MRELLGEAPINEKRLYEEASGAAQHGDITEEAHPPAGASQGDGTATRPEQERLASQIEFLLQEINREINTMGAKSQDAQTLADYCRDEGRSRKDARAGAERRVMRNAVSRLQRICGYIMACNGVRLAPRGAG